MKNNYYTNPNYTKLHSAVMSNDMQEVKAILDTASPRYIMAASVDNNHHTAFSLAIALDRIDIAEEIFNAYRSKGLAFVETTLQPIEESLSHTIAKLNSLEFSSFITPAFLHHDENMNMTGESYESSER